MCHLSTEFCENRFGGSCGIPTANKQTDKQTNQPTTNADENITSLAEIIKLWAAADRKSEEDWFINQSIILFIDAWQL